MRYFLLRYFLVPLTTFFFFSATVSYADFPYKTCPNPTVVISDISYDWAEIPTGTAEKDKIDYLTEMNDFYENTFIFENKITPDLSLADVEFKTNPCAHKVEAPAQPYWAIRSIDKSQPHAELVWLDATDLRPIPDLMAKPIAATKQRHLMSLTRTYSGNWSFVSDRKVFGWTQAEVIPLASDDTPIPKIDTNNPPPSFEVWKKHKLLEKNILLLQSLILAKNEAKLSEARAKICPNDFNEREIDDLVSLENRPRSDLHKVCNGSGERLPRQKLKTVSLKVKSCMCTEVSEDDADLLEVHIFPPPGKVASDCELLKKHVLCLVDLDESGSTSLACPLRCVDFSK